MTSTSSCFTDKSITFIQPVSPSHLLIPGGEDCEVHFTLSRQPGVSDEKFAGDAGNKQGLHPKNGVPACCFFARF